MYFTTYIGKNKQLVKTANDLIYNIEGVNAIHSGVEIESVAALLNSYARPLWCPFSW